MLTEETGLETSERLAQLGKKKDRSISYMVVKAILWSTPYLTLVDNFRTFEWPKREVLEALYA